MPAPDNVAVLDRIVAAPGRALAAILVLHAVVWTALPALLYANLPLDLIEALTYGREWQLGYDKLPPLPWWLVEIVYRLAGHDFAYYLLAQAAVVTALWLVFLTARPIAGPIGALIAVLIVDGLHYFNYTATKFNHDVIQLPFWALAGFAFHRALRGGWLGHWLLLGLAIGISLWAKYFVVVLAVPLAVIPRVRQRRAKDARNARPLHCRSGRARDHGAASGLAGAERLPAFFLRRAPRAAITRADRPCLASLPVRAGSGILPRAFGPHCCAAVFPEAGARKAVAATHSTGASSAGSLSARR